MELCSVQYKNVVLFFLLAMISAVVLSVSTSLYWYFESATGTHCGVPNFLPTISAAFGDKPIPKFIWQLITGLHGPQRFVDAYLYYRFFGALLKQRSPSINSWRQKIGQALNAFVCLLHVCEDSALLVLTFVTSRDNYPVHEMGFIVFIVAAFLYMILATVLFLEANGTLLSERARRSFRWRVTWLLVKIIFFIVSMYLFFRHNWYCEPYMYSYYAACEYVVILANILYHAVIIIDLADVTLTIGCSSKKSS